MKKICAGIVIVCMAGFIVTGTCVGGKGSRDGEGDQTRDKDRLQDGSCREVIQLNGDLPIVLAGDQDRDQKRDRGRDRLKDGSCREVIQWNGNVPILLAGDQDRTRDKNQSRDESCQDDG